MIEVKKLAAIYNIWDGVELLKGSIDCIKNHVDLIIIVYQNTSNFGEPFAPLSDIDTSDVEAYHCPVIYEKYTPIAMGGTFNEQNKRNIGITIARKNGCSHFFHIDVDEYYEDFGKSFEEYMELGSSGSVCPIYTYFKKPTWRLETLDNYYVPFIHHLKDHTASGYGFNYKYYVDPTRVINEADVSILSTPMHHYSWVRNDIKRKARNSSAGQQGNKLTGLLDIYSHLDSNSDPTGFIIPDMGNQKLIVVEDFFGIGDVLSV